MTEQAKTKERIRAFVERWTGRGYEKGESQVFWLELLHDVLNVERPTEVISFESQVQLSHASFIDAYIPRTKVLIEQKSLDKDLRKPIPHSDGTMLTPLEQAKRYAHELPYSKYPRWVVACNFRSFLIYDMEHTMDEPFEIRLEDLERDGHLLGFMVETERAPSVHGKVWVETERAPSVHNIYGRVSLQHEIEVSTEAGSKIGKLYDAFLKEYGEEVTETDLHALNVLCVRLVFCLYAEDAGIFSKCQFAYYLMDYTPNMLRNALKELFVVLDTPTEKRSRFLDAKLKAFPYVNGSLFREQAGEEIPPFTEETMDLLVREASLGFDWSQISPTIFGAVFESTLNPETRRSGGMHYTSIENIHKVIDPLFMEELTAEYERIAAQPEGKVRRKRLEEFQERLSGLRFLDPACGSGNFLTETYVSLRRLENRVIEQLTQGQMLLGMEEVNPIRVNIQQFYGIEINDFAVTVAKTALWIAEAQMMAETEKIIKFNDDYLPLKSYNNIAEGNALRMDWNEVIAAEELDYIIGNPPFVGYSLQSREQKEDMLAIYVDKKGKPYKTAGKIDYVAGWYYKAAKMMQGTKIRAALVSTNSITQGEQVASVWKPLYDQFGIHIDFAWRTFRWDSESALMAHVHCVIIGFSQSAQNKMRRIYSVETHGRASDGKNIYCSETHGRASLQVFPGEFEECENINPYLVNARTIFLLSPTKPVSAVPQLLNGGKPTEGGFLILTEEEKEELIKKEPQAKIFIRPYMMGKDFIERKTRYCLWMVNASPTIVRSCPSVLERIKNVRDYRLKSPKEATRKKAETPMLFDEVRECSEDYIAIPKVSSERRRYIPMDYLSKDIIPGDKLFMMPNAGLYEFGILTSSVHMGWMRAVCGRLKSDYSYSNTIVYNNFPWPTPSDSQRERIEHTAQGILDARALYPDSSLADLYDDLTMPAELRKAHQANDRAVMEAYGFAATMSEIDIVARLLEMYERLTKNI